MIATVLLVVIASAASDGQNEDERSKQMSTQAAARMRLGASVRGVDFRVVREPACGESQLSRRYCLEV